MKYEHWQIPAAPEDAIKALMAAGYPVFDEGHGQGRRAHLEGA